MALNGATHPTISAETSACDLIIPPLPAALITYQAAAWPATLWTSTGTLSAPPASDFATGRIVIPQPPGSVTLFEFFGTGADNDNDFNWMIREWRSIRSGRTSALQYRVKVIADGTAVLGTQVGIAGGHITDTMRMCDQIVVTNDRSLSPHGARVVGPATADNNVVALAVDTCGAPLLEVILRRGSGTAPTGLGFGYYGLSGV